jgi:hypothetical protein
MEVSQLTNQCKTIKLIIPRSRHRNLHKNNIQFDLNAYTPF